ncbi:MAG: type I DNA topoisomerase [Proteobacteria bacterium]|nr:type I DNA topoisomerase [Pseudomonadota bacterium]
MNLLIVESPAKAKTIEKYLGAGWQVVASIGHVRDLVPEDGSVDTEHDFAMKWQIMPGKEKQIKIILDAVKKANAVYLASDPDREGEAISWHLLDILNSRGALKGKPVYRVVFHEITKKAVNEAIKEPREIDQNLVDAYLVRRALDYLIGFKLSPVLWRKNMGRSAGRVQSVAVALVVDREREIEAFKPVEYWSLGAECVGANVNSPKTTFVANLTKFNGDKIEKMSIGNQGQMDTILAALGEPIIPAAVISVEKKKTSRKPAPPFTTSTLQQEAARKLYFSAKRTSSAAQKLYEVGLITYIRTDSTNLSADAVAGIRDYIKSEYGDKFLPSAPNIYLTKSKNAQEAHEAIRPTDVGTGHWAPGTGGDEEKLYDLIWKRTVACQMTNAEFDSVVVDIETQSNTPSLAEGAARDFAGREAGLNNQSAIFHAVGTTRTFDGFMKVYIEDTDDTPPVAHSGDTPPEGGNALPPLAVGDKIDIVKLLPEQHFTQPPPRYSEASLIKKLEELGIGRPSTYASIMATIVDKEYVRNEKQRFFPTPGGWMLTAFLAHYFTNIVDVNFTAKTEDTLDDVSNGEEKKLAALNAFWNAFSPLVDTARGIPNPDVMTTVNAALAKHLFPNDDNKCPECGTGTLSLKVSRYGAFLACSNYPDCKYTRDLKSEPVGANVNSPNNTDDSRANSHSPLQNGSLDLGENIKFLVGRFGPYVQEGAGKDAKRASAKKYDSNTITLEIAKELLSADRAAKAEPIEIGKNPATDKMIYFYPTGRYGPYLSSNKVNVSVKEQPDLATAADLINNKKPSAKKGWSRRGK